MSLPSPVCTCGDTNCPFNPVNHNQGCGPCILKNLSLREIPSCFFNLLDDHGIPHQYSFEDFAKLVLSQHWFDVLNHLPQSASHPSVCFPEILLSVTVYGKAEWKAHGAPSWLRKNWMDSLMNYYAEQYSCSRSVRHWENTKFADSLYSEQNKQRRQFRDTQNDG